MANGIRPHNTHSLKRLTDDGSYSAVQVLWSSAIFQASLALSPLSYSILLCPRWRRSSLPAPPLRPLLYQLECLRHGTSRCFHLDVHGLRLGVVLSLLIVGAQLLLTDQLLSFSAWHCWLGLLTRKNGPRYDLFGGTLNPTLLLLLSLHTAVAPSDERFRGEGKCGCLQVKLCDPHHLSALDVSFSRWGALQIYVYVYRRQRIRVTEPSSIWPVTEASVAKWNQRIPKIRRW